jgi:hypothetical protein
LQDEAEPASPAAAGEDLSAAAEPENLSRDLDDALLRGAEM